MSQSKEAKITATETGHVTGTKDKDYDLIWYVEGRLDNALRLETYLQDAERSGTPSSPSPCARHRPIAVRVPRSARSCCARASVPRKQPSRKQRRPSPSRKSNLADECVR